MKKLFLLLALFGVLAVGCENLFPNEQVPNSVFVTDGEGAYILEAEGGEVVVTIATNVDYSIVIPEEAQAWLSVAETRAESRMETQTFIIVENDSFETRLADVEFVNGRGEVLKTLLFTQKCYTKVFEIDADGNYLVDAEGGEVNVAVTTNLEYNVAIPEEAQSWLSVADTRATVREETLTFIVAKNNSYDERLASVELVDSKGDVLQTIGFIQSAVEMCPSNEIWYTSADGNIVEPYSGEGSQDNFAVFGANIVSNTYNAEKECWVIEFDGDVTTIGEDAFYGCSSLTSVTIPDSVTSIGRYAFRDCSSLTSVTIGDSVTTIGTGAFYNCSSLTSVTIGDSVTKIGSSAFSGCSSLTSVTIGDSVTTIGDETFGWCESLTSVTIGDSVTTIGDSAFWYCSSLTSVTIPDSVTTIGDYAFACCSKLREFNGKYASEDGRCLIIDGTLNSFAIGCGVTEYTIPDSVTTIGYAAFACCSSLTSVTIPDSVTTIGDEAFGWCESLTSVTIGDSVTTIGYMAFAYCSSLTSVTIPDSVTSIGERAFLYCDSLTSITIPDSVTTIGEWAFAYCSSLTSVTIGDSVTTIGYGPFTHCSKLREFNGKYASEDGRCLIIDGTLNSFAPAGLTEYTIPDSVTTIGKYAFYECRSLTNVTIPDSVTTIGDWAFSGCDSLTSVTIPENVTAIGNYAFCFCSSLTNLTIPDSVTTIGYGAFYGCWCLTSVYCKAVTPPAGEYDMFSNNAYGRKIYVPTESVEAYKSSEGWSDYASDIVGSIF